MRRIKLNVAVLLSVILTYIACKPDPSLDVDATVPENISFSIPEGWPTPFYNFQNNTLTKDGFYLGRKLFYDPRLSRDNTISCGSCHQIFAAFAHDGHAISHGIDGLLGTRNSPALFNLNWHTGFFWDGGVNHIESQPLNPIQNPVEMDENLPNIIAKLQADEKYKQMFVAAWGDETVTSQRIFKSLAQFMGMIVSDHSKYDQYMRGEAALTTAEQNGMKVYNEKCAACHTAPLFSNFSYRNNGLQPSAVNDSGRMRITQQDTDMYKFKVPSLRNLKYTAPYMHDGRFKTIDRVLDHYTTGIYQTPTLDPLLQNGLSLSAQERSDLMAFLNTLNDEVLVTDSRFKEPAN
ncbi:MAG: c-type cytochrome [Chitinophagaceae bacterium]|nr:c-type cytochrome [Chitinophagaceae bacterium]MCB9044565.1 c-type cytochrome [Chitinophagales bacterium]